MYDTVISLYLKCFVEVIAFPPKVPCISLSFFLVPFCAKPVVHVHVHVYLMNDGIYQMTNVHVHNCMIGSRKIELTGIKIVCAGTCVCDIRFMVVC